MQHFSQIAPRVCTLVLFIYSCIDYNIHVMLLLLILLYTVHRVLDYGQLPIWAYHRCTPCRSLSFLANAYTVHALFHKKIMHANWGELERAPHLPYCCAKYSGPDIYIYIYFIFMGQIHIMNIFECHLHVFLFNTS